MLVRRLAAPGEGPCAIPVRPGAIPPRFAAAAAEAGFLGEAECCELLAGRPVLLAGAGEGAERDFRAAGECAARHWRRHPRIALDLRGLDAGSAAAFAGGAWLGAWRFDRFQHPSEGAPRLSEIDLIADAPDFAAVWARAAAAAEAACFARDLVAEPGGTLNPETFASRLSPLQAAGVTLQALDAAELRRLGAGGMLAVGGGSVHSPRLLVLRWGAAPRPLALLGKGITFDTGGICIKPADRMWEMRGDMAGAAACAGAMLALARRQASASVIAVLAVAENAIGGGAYRPGDVLRSLEGRSVEVVDTDAEGRLVLMDALAWAVRQNPAAIIDCATLTGSAVTALGHHRAALFANDDALARAVFEAGEAVGERVWRLPIGDRHRSDLDSDIADLRHCVPGRGQPDACQAAAFLREFVGGVPWAHIDMAGTDLEMIDGETGGPTGFGARLLDRLIAGHFEAR